MRIATITNWAYGFTVGLTLISGTTMLLASRAEDRERAAVAQRERFEELTATLEADTFRLTEQARLFAINGHVAHLVVYRREADELGGVEARLRPLQDAGAQPAELSALRDGLHAADLLHDEQLAAVAAVQRGNSDGARQILFGAEYQRDLERVDAMLDRFQDMLRRRTEAAVTDAEGSTRLLRTSSEVMIGLTALLFLCVLVFILKRRILRPVVKLSDVISRLAAQDYEVEPPPISQVDEIGDMAQAIRVFQENGLERQRLEKERAADQARRDLLARMTQRLQGCDNKEDVAEVVRLFASELAPAFAGRLYIDDESRVMVEACSWLDPRDSVAEFVPSDCWALRRGQLHRPAGAKIDIRCPHANASDNDDICVPVTAHGETIGMIFFERRAAEIAAPETLETYLELLAETVGLALANLRLRDVLRAMALVDPLTGLANRRQLDALLRVQISHAEQQRQPLSCLMLDIDHFKRFNDTHGHDAGDAILKAVGEILGHAVRGEGTAFRYGGEEFLLLMPGFDSPGAMVRAEQIQARIRELKLKHEGKAVGTLTCSIGIATYPDHGAASTLVQTADAALLRAKDQGRDRILLATARGTLAA